MERSKFWFATALLLPSLTFPASAAEAEPKATPMYTATAMLRIHRTPPHVLETSEQKFDPAEFDCYKRTQAELVKSPFVIIAALRSTPEMIKKRPQALPSLLQEEKRHHAVAWLGKKLRVTFPSPGSEIMKVSLTLPDAEEAATLVNAAVKAYIDEVVNVERIENNVRYDRILQCAAENENLLRFKRTELRQLADNLGVAELNIKESPIQQMEVQTLVQLQMELNRMIAESMQHKRRMDQLVALASQLSEEEVSATELDGYLQQNSTEYRDLQNKKIALENWKQNTFGNRLNVDESKLPLSTRQSLNELKVITDQIDALKSNAKERVVQERRLQIQREIRQLQADSQGLATLIAALREDLKARADKLEDRSRTSIDVTMKQAEIQNLEKILATLSSEQLRLHVELKAPSRVSIVGDPNNPAEIPESPDEPQKKVRHEQKAEDKISGTGKNGS